MPVGRYIWPDPPIKSPSTIGLLYFFMITKVRFIFHTGCLASVSRTQEQSGNKRYSQPSQEQCVFQICHLGIIVVVSICTPFEASVLKLSIFFSIIPLHGVCWYGSKKRGGGGVGEEKVMMTLSDLFFLKPSPQIQNWHQFKKKNTIKRLARSRFGKNYKLAFDLHCIVHENSSGVSTYGLNTSSRRRQ